MQDLLLWTSIIVLLLLGVALYFIGRKVFVLEREIWKAKTKTAKTASKVSIWGGVATFLGIIIVMAILDDVEVSKDEMISIALAPVALLWSFLASELFKKILYVVAILFAAYLILAPIQSKLDEILRRLRNSN